MTADNRPVVPRAAARSVPPALVSLGLVPFPLQRAVLERALAIAFREPLERGEMAFLEGRRLRVTVLDAGWCWDITHDGAGLRVRRPAFHAGGTADVELRASLHSFALLATRRSDPDTLFFQRRLTVIGDTELGLACKNLMDSLEPESWHPLAPAVLRTIGGWL